jgi:hypothetical protein
MNSKESVNTQTIILFSICALFVIAPLIAIIAFESVIVQQKVTVLTHYKNLCLLPSRIKYSLVFSLETLATMSILPLIPESPSDGAADYYNKVTYDTFTDTEVLFKGIVPSSYSDYVTIYKAVIYQSACSHVQALNNGRPSLSIDACKANNFMNTGVYTSATQILTRSNQVLQQVDTILAGSPTVAAKEAAKITIVNGLLSNDSSIGTGK